MAKAFARVVRRPTVAAVGAVMAIDHVRAIDVTVGVGRHRGKSGEVTDQVL